MPKIETPGMFRERIAENFIVGETGHLAFQEGGKERIDAMIAERDAAIRAESADAERERDALKARVVELEAKLQGARKQWETFARKIWGSGRVMNVEQFVAEGLSAIVGKKEG